MITTRFGRVGALASKSRVLLGSRSMATVSNSPLDKKVEMCNHEKKPHVVLRETIGEKLKFKYLSVDYNPLWKHGAASSRPRKPTVN
ncbi:hypothetical protein ACJ72_03292 [Emergomyces africanus]|uniref:Uncharacterized protein n=1 Tax=Emergomyces africanus TaxID=1955775 RepID=A0A1B7P003_9EURO|nr:hypothetical protein ACJ72_03292 [Emergomyces africanus]